MSQKRDHGSTVDVENWTAEQVLEWLLGLDDVILKYQEILKDANITGKKLMLLSHFDLTAFGIVKLGHQELILNAVQLLRDLRYELNRETLQSISLQLACKAKSLHNEVKLLVQNEVDIEDKSQATKHLPVSILSSLRDLVSTITYLIFWFDRAPFQMMYELTLQRDYIVKIAIDLISTVQRHLPTTDNSTTIMQYCSLLSDLCDELVCNSQDPLLVQPAWLEQVNVHRKEAEEELGLNILSMYNGSLVIDSIRDMSAADTCGKINKGDEVVAVNYQIIVGWSLKNFKRLLFEKPTDVDLLLKKRPCHLTGIAGSGGNKKHPTSQISTLPKSQQKRRSRDAEKLRPSLQELGLYMSDELPVREGVDTDNEVFPNGLEAASLRLHVDSNKPRRATVSGGSPVMELTSDICDEIIDGSHSSNTESGEAGESIDELVLDTCRVAPAYSSMKYLTVEQPSTPNLEQTFLVPQPYNTSSMATSKPPELLTPPRSKKLSTISQKSTESIISTGSQASLPENLSYSITVIGGVVQKTPVDRPSTPREPDQNVILRSRTSHERKKVDRRVSCKDLGEGDCEGWLYRKKKSGGSGLLTNKWHKRWCVLKNLNLYCYKQRDDPHAEGVIHLPSFKISPDELENRGLTGSKKMFTFKVYNSGAGFYFASDRMEDMSKWMNKMGLASIVYGPNGRGNSETNVAYSDSSDSSDRDSSPMRAVDRSKAQRGNESHGLETTPEEQDDILTVLRSLQEANVGVSGHNRRSTNILSTTSEHLDKQKYFMSLERTIKDKERAVQAIDRLLENGSPSPSMLREFCEKYQYLIFPLSQSLSGTRL